ncbi:MAG: hypothetical protein R3C58_11405 [Parvularculaceae bacterium]
MSPGPLKAVWRCAAVLCALALAPLARAEAPPADLPAMTALKISFDYDGLAPLTAFMLAPADYRTRENKVLIYFIGGGQEEKYAEGALNYYVATEAVRRGYVVIAPGAPCYDCTFVAKGADYFPAFFDKLREIIPMAEDRFHLMGYSNGGRSAFHLATRHPDQVASITTYPGYLRNRKLKLLEELGDVCVVMYVGRKDAEFLSEHRRDAQRLKKLGHGVYAKEYFHEGHKIEPLWTEEGAKTLMDGVDNRLGCAGEPAPAD